MYSPTPTFVPRGFAPWDAGVGAPAVTEQRETYGQSGSGGGRSRLNRRPRPSLLPICCYFEVFSPQLGQRAPPEREANSLHLLNASSARGTWAWHLRMERVTAEPLLGLPRVPSFGQRASAASQQACEPGDGTPKGQLLQSPTSS